jgi:preprotein translocase subunit SecD
VLRYRLDVEAALRDGTVAPGTRPEAVVRDTVAIVRARLAAAGIAGAEVAAAPPLGFAVTSEPQGAAQLARLRRLVETPGKLELVMVAPAGADANEARTGLLAWLDADGNRERVLREPAFAQTYRAGPVSKIRWVAHPVRPDAQSPSTWQRPYAEAAGPAVPLFELERLRRPPASPTEQLVELVPLDESDEAFRGADLDPDRIRATRSPGEDHWDIAYGVRAARAGAMRELSGRSIGRSQAVVLDGIVLVAPVFQSAISGSGVIRGMFTREEAEDLALLLRIGTLPIPPVRS